MLKRFKVSVGGPSLLMIEGLRRVAEDRFLVVSTSSDFDSFLRAVERERPDIAVIDSGEGQWDPIRASENLTSAFPGLRIMVLVSDTRIWESSRTNRRRDCAALAKASDPMEFVRAIGAWSGRGIVPAEYSARQFILHQQARRENPNRESNDNGIREGLSTSGDRPLTARQQDILRLVRAGESVKSMARHLGISARTVEFHKYKLMKSLSIRSTIGLVRFAIEANRAPSGGERTLAANMLSSSARSPGSIR
jgi:DNA-binding NarL/FixJ family response regulator